MENKKEITAMQEICEMFKKFNLIDNNCRLTTHAFDFLVKPYASDLVVGMLTEDCESDRVVGLFEHMYVLLKNNFTQAAYIILEQEYRMCDIPMPKILREFCSDECYATTLLMVFAENLEYLYENLDWELIYGDDEDDGDE